MRRFASERSFVKPLTNGAMTEGVTQGASGFIETTTRKPALNFWIDKVRWLSDSRADVEGGGGAAGSSGDAGVFRVVYKKPQWVVQSYTQEVMF